MKKSVSNKIDVLLSGLVDRLEKIENIAIEQFPDFCKELVAEHRVDIENGAIASGLASVLLIAVDICLALYSFDPEHGDARAISGIFFLLFLAGSICGVSQFVCYLLELRVLKVAPRVYVLDRLRKMIHK